MIDETTLAGLGWRFNDSVENENRIKPLCQEIEKHFQLPSLRLLRFFAVTDYPELSFFGNYRGFHASYSANCFSPFPMDVFKSFYPQFSEGISRERIFDNVIYIRASTCSENTGLVLTYAHELQHFVQYGTLPRLHHVNGILYWNLKSVEPTAIATDVPNERDANIVSKRVAEIVCGSDAVQEFANTQINKMMQLAGEYRERDRWIFFRDVSSTAPYDWVSDTLRLVEKYNGQIDFRIDMNRPDWWLGPLEL